MARPLQPDVLLGMQPVARTMFRPLPCPAHPWRDAAYSWRVDGKIAGAVGCLDCLKRQIADAEQVAPA